MSPVIEITNPLLLNEQTVIIDARGFGDPRQRYLDGHLPRAIFANLDGDLAVHPADPAFGGRHPLPPISTFAETLGRWGITPQTPVVVYDDKFGANSAARLWWMLKGIGHQNVQVLNGGLQAAIDAGIELAADDHQPIAASPYPVPKEYAGTVNIEEAGAAAQSNDRIVIDVRENPRYLGITEPLDLVAGHIPGAINLPYNNNLGADGKYLSPDELKEVYRQAVGDIAPEDIIVHCGSGVTACHTLLGMEYAGMPGANLYVGSWSEWSRRGLPIATDGK